MLSIWGRVMTKAYGCLLACLCGVMLVSCSNVKKAQKPVSGHQQKAGQIKKTLPKALPQQKSSSPKAQKKPVVKVPAKPASQKPQKAASNTRQTVLDLLATAQKYLRKGDTRKAQKRLEQALRIESQNPYIWYNLSVVKFYQGKYLQAVHTAEKADALTVDRKLRYDNWHVIYRAWKKLRKPEKQQYAARQMQRFAP